MMKPELRVNANHMQAHSPFTRYLARTHVAADSAYFARLRLGLAPRCAALHLLLAPDEVRLRLITFNASTHVPFASIDLNVMSGMIASARGNCFVAC